ncbi:MAG: hypothetical protein FD165_2056, partial [Gammaproteobacteria bacterium]
SYGIRKGVISGKFRILNGGDEKLDSGMRRNDGWWGCLGLWRVLE